jgi:hypothetical protein
LKTTARILLGQAYQVGIHEEARTFAMKDRKRVAEAHCKNEHKHSLPAIKNIQAAVASQSSWKRKQPRPLTLKKRQKEERERNHSIALNKVEAENETIKSGKQHNMDTIWASQVDAMRLKN